MAAITALLSANKSIGNRKQIFCDDANKHTIIPSNETEVVCRKLSFHGMPVLPSFLTTLRTLVCCGIHFDLNVFSS